MPNPKVQGCGYLTFPRCSKCCKNHGGKCLKDSGACYKCGKMDHKLTNYLSVSNRGRHGHPQGYGAHGGQGSQGGQQGGAPREAW